MSNSFVIERMWKMGELAQATALTVRALRHYEAMGLICPTNRTSGRQRLYDRTVARQIFQIRALCGLGLSLAEASDVLADATAVGDALRMHLAHAEAEINRLTLLRDQLRVIVDGNPPASLDNLTQKPRLRGPPMQGSPTILPPRPGSACASADVPHSKWACDLSTCSSIAAHGLQFTEALPSRKGS